MPAIVTKILGVVSARLLEFLAENFIVPAMMYLFNKGMLIYDKRQGKIKYKKFQDAKKDNNEDDYNSIIDDI